MSIAINGTNSEKITWPPIQQAPATSDKQARNQQPHMRELTARQAQSIFHRLPEDVLPRILNHSGHGVFELGLTCKYWNLRVRNHVTHDTEGCKALRNKEEAIFRSTYRMSVVNACRAEKSSSSSIQFFHLGHEKAECINLLKTSNDPVQLNLEQVKPPLADGLKAALATRRGKLTLMNFLIRGEQDIPLMKEAITAVPRGGFVGLTIRGGVFAELDLTSVWDEIAAHPVVAHIQFDGKNDPEDADQVVKWIAQLAKQRAQVSSFTLDSCRLDKQSEDALSTLLVEQTGITEFEVREMDSCLEVVPQLAEVARKRNASTYPKLNLYLAAGNLHQLIDAPERSSLANDGIHIQSRSHLWVFQKDPVQEDPVQEDSVDADSSIIVSEPSSDGDTNSIVERSSDSKVCQIF